MQSNNNEEREEPPNNTNDQQEEEHQNKVEDDETNLEDESLSREELIELVKKTKKELAVAKKKAEESSKLAQQELAKLEKALLVSQQKVEELTITRLPLPLELNCEIFKCLKLPVQREFIWGLGRDIYGMFGEKLLKKTKRVRNPPGNRWSRTNTRVIVAVDGLHVRSEFDCSANVFAEQAFSISGPQCRVDGFPGTICYYYEVKGRLQSSCRIGFSEGDIPVPDQYANSYAVSTGGYSYEYVCGLGRELHQLELPEGGILPKRKMDVTDVYGRGLILDPENKLFIFFTVNGKLVARKIRISPTVERLFPTVQMEYDIASFETNFGDDPAKPFEYDIQKCPGLELDCI